MNVLTDYNMLINILFCKGNLFTNKQATKAVNIHHTFVACLSLPLFCSSERSAKKSWSNAFEIRDSSAVSMLGRWKIL